MELHLWMRGEAFQLPGIGKALELIQFHDPQRCYSPIPDHGGHQQSCQPRTANVQIRLLGRNLLSDSIRLGHDGTWPPPRLRS